MYRMVVKPILCHPILHFISHFIFIFMNINNIFRNWGKMRKAYGGIHVKNAHITVTDRPRRLKLVSNDCLDIVL